MPRGCEDAPTRRRLHPTLNTLVERILCVGPLVAEAAGLDSPGTLIVHGPIYAARSWIRAKHMPEDSKDTTVLTAREYQKAIEDYLEATLAARQGPSPPLGLVDKALERFMGDHRPHDWPIGMTEVEQLGIPVTSASSRWAILVDDYRRRWWR